MPNISPSKPFPWKCSECRQQAVQPKTIAYTTRIEHDARTYEVSLPDLDVFQCENCGDMILDDLANQRITQALREQANLLTPFEIRSNRERLGFTQKELATRLGIAESTLSRWETGVQIQQRSLDRFLRLFFRLKEVRELLAQAPPAPSISTQIF